MQGVPGHASLVQSTRGTGGGTGSVAVAGRGGNEKGLNVAAGVATTCHMPLVVLQSSSDVVVVDQTKFECRQSPAG